MFLARKSKLVLSAAALSVFGGLTGCIQHHANSAPAEVVAPAVADEAMQRRDWGQSTAIYPNGGVAAGPTNFLYEPRRDMPEYRYTVDDSAVFLLNMALLPYEIIVHPPNTIEVAQGETYLPTYTAMPVMPPSANPGPEIESLPSPASPVIESPTVSNNAAKSQATPSATSPAVSRPSYPYATPSRSTTSPGARPSSPVIDSLPTSPGAQPTGSPLVTPGRGQPQSPPVTLPPPTPTHPASKPLAPTSSGASSSAAPAPVVHAPTTQASKSTDLESPSALDLSLAPPLSNSQTSTSQTITINPPPTETRIVGGKLTVVPSTQPTTSPVNWPPLNK